MLFKLLLLIGIIAAVYYFYFKPKSVTKKTTNPPRREEKDQEMVECRSCGTFITLDDALIKGGHYYCSKECLEK